MIFNTIKLFLDVDNNNNNINNQMNNKEETSLVFTDIKGDTERTIFYIQPPLWIVYVSTAKKLVRLPCYSPKYHFLDK